MIGMSSFYFICTGIQMAIVGPKIERAEQKYRNCYSCIKKLAPMDVEVGVCMGTEHRLYPVHRVLALAAMLMLQS